jgi:hypothetical protein
MKIITLKILLFLSLVIIFFAGCKPHQNETSHGPTKLTQGIADRNSTFAKAVLQGMVADLNSLQATHEELSYLNDFTNMYDTRYPIFACIEFTYKPLTFPKTERRFMADGYSFGVWFWDLWSGQPPTAIERDLPLGLDHRTAQTRGGSSMIGFGVATIYGGNVPEDVKNVVEAALERLEQLGKWEFWQRGENRLDGGIFVIRPPAAGSSEVVVSFGLCNRGVEEQTLELSNASVLWTVDGQTQMQPVARITAQPHKEHVSLPVHRAIMFPPLTISLPEPGVHEITAAFHKNPRTDPVVLAKIKISNE